MPKNRMKNVLVGVNKQINVNRFDKNMVDCHKLMIQFKCIMFNYVLRHDIACSYYSYPIGDII